MQQAETERLIEQLQDAEASLGQRHIAFSALVSAYQDMAFGYAYTRLGNWQQAQDAAQEAFILAYQHIDQLREPQAFALWLRRIVQRCCQRSVQGLASRQDPLEAADELASPEPGPEAALAEAEQHSEVMTAVHALPTHEREAIVLYYVNGYSQQEVAGFLDIAPPLVRKRLQRGRDHLRRTMMDLIRENLGAHRPSKDDAFLRAVQLATTLDEAAMEAQLSVLEAALVDGIDINAAGAGGQTLLHWAARRGNVEAVKLLLRYGADPTVLDRQARTPQRVARDVGHQELADLLGEAEGQLSTGEAS